MVEYADYLNLASINRLFNNEILVLCINDYKKYDNHLIINDRINAYKTSYSYSHENGVVSHIGNSSYEIDMEPERFKIYYESVDTNYQLMKQFFSPYTTPIESLLSDFKNIWPYGIQIERMHDKQMFAGMIRIIHKNSAIHAHQDHVKWSNPKSLVLDEIFGQYGINYFIQVPNEGGNLMLWNNEFSKNEFNQLSKGNFYIPIENLPYPDLQIKPAEGMLVILNARKLHAIQCSYDCDRITMSCFLAYRDTTQPLSLWS